MESAQDLIARAVTTGTSWPEAKGVCPRCGTGTEPMAVAFSKLGRRVDSYCAGCLDAMKREDAEHMARLAEQAKKEARQRRLDALWESASLGPRFIAATFDCWESMPGTERALEQVKKYAAGWPYEDGRGLLLTGSTGCGKTHLAAALVRSLLEKEVPCVFQSVPELLRRLRAGMGSPAGSWSADELTRSLEECSLLVLDDLGSERWTAWAEECLYTLIDYRYRHQQPMVVTTNLDLKALETAVGTRILDRLVEVCQPLQLQCGSFRRRKAELRVADAGMMGLAGGRAPARA